MRRKRVIPSHRELLAYRPAMVDTCRLRPYNRFLQALTMSWYETCLAPTVRWVLSTLFCNSRQSADTARDRAVAAGVGWNLAVQQNMRRCSLYGTAIRPSAILRRMM